MTCIIGLVHDGKVYMGADSQATGGADKRTTVQPKVFKTGPFLIGYTTSFRMGQLLQYQLEVKPQGEESDYAYLVTSFIEAVRSTLKDHGFAKVDSNQEEGGNFLVGYNGHLYEVNSDMAILENATGLDAVGSGEDYALGAMAALDGLPPEERIKRAFVIVSAFSNSVSGPFVILEQPA